MRARLLTARVLQVSRYYQAGIINTAFGISTYSLLVWLGMNMFLAQLVSHCLGVAFNYISYSQHVFRGAPTAKLRFVMSYVVNYLMGLALLAAAAHFIASPYIAFAVAVVILSIINYLVLKNFVFGSARA